MKKYALYWLDGKREVVSGKDLVNAIMSAGYGAGAMSALDFTCNGEDNSYEWVNGKWINTGR